MAEEVDDDTIYLNMTLGQCLRHGHASVRTEADLIETEVNRERSKKMNDLITLASLLEHPNKVVRVLVEGSIIPELKSIDREKQLKNLVRERSPEITKQLRR